MGDYKNQADFAGRIGKIAKTYQRAAQISREQNPQEELYEATLHICLLHTLLTSCHEVIRMMKRDTLCHLSNPLSESGIWGLHPSRVQTMTFVNECISLESIIEHMRHAVSHPASWKVFLAGRCSHHQPTGFYRSHSDENGQVAAFTFIDSPDVYHGAPKSYENENSAKHALGKRRIRKTDEFEYIDVGFPKKAWVGLGLDERYHIYNVNDDEYTRIFKIEIPVENLQEFVQELSCFLYRHYGNERRN